jgi:hypothetical protein
MSPDGAPVFMRFVVGSGDAHHSKQTGIITEVYRLRDAGALAPHEEERLGDILVWLDEHLTFPPISPPRGQGPGAGMGASASAGAVCWFKAGAGADEPLRKLQEIVAILREHGTPVRVLQTGTPGKVVYEDDFQVVVVE